MPNRVRWVLASLVLALVGALAGVPTAPTLADDNARIDAPTAGERVLGTVEIRGRAVTSDPSRFSFYRLHYGSGPSPSSLRPIGSAGDQPVEDGILGIWDTRPLIQGEYFVQLTVYDTSGATETTGVVVNVLPAPTPTPRSQASFEILVPGQTPTASEEESGPTPTPVPEIPPLVPQIPQFEAPQPNTGPQPVQPVQPSTTDPSFRPIQIDPGVPSSQPPLPAPPLPGAPAPGAPPPFDPGSSIPPPAPINPVNPVNPVGPPGAPAVAPYEPPPTVAAPPTPTTFGLP
jgi:hypothetical protein